MKENGEVLSNAPDWWSKTVSEKVSNKITIRIANTVRKIVCL